MKYVLKKVRAIRIDDIATGKHKATLNDLTQVQLTTNNDVVYAEGTDGARLAAYENNKVATLTATNGTIETEYLALQMGTSVVSVANGKSIKIRETLTTNDGSTIHLTYQPSGTAGSEIGYIYTTDVNGNPKDAYAQAASASATAFALTDATTGTITLPTGVASIGDSIIVDYYPTFSAYEEIAASVDKYSETGHVYVDCWFTDICSQADIPAIIELPRGKISGNLDLSFGDQVAVQNIEIEALVKNCSNDERYLWKWYIYDLNDATKTN